MNIVGLSAFFHESACCLLRDGRVVAAAEEERFSRVKHDPRLPVSAFRFCLRAGGIGLTDVDALAFYESPRKKLSRQLWAGIPEGAPPDLPWLDPGAPERAIREGLGWEGPILFFDHHVSHAASAFLLSDFPAAALLTVDGVGEWATTSYGRGQGAEVELFEEVDFPHSLGLLYATLTSYLGFAVNDGEYKVMGLAPYGEPRHLDALRRLVTLGSEGQYRLNLDYFEFIRGRRMYSDALPALLGEPPRKPEAGITRFHQDAARSLQALLEEILLAKAAWLHERTGLPDLCMAGGVALNVVANGRILREGPFERLFVQPAAGDSGGCLGAAALAHGKLTGRRPEPLRHVYLGPRWSSTEIAGLLTATGIEAQDHRGREAELLEAVVDRLERGEVVGWFHGPMELGPRALGGRSLLADPRDPQMRDRLNRLVKKREAFRPFAPSVLAAHAAEHFALDHPSPYMLICANLVIESQGLIAYSGFMSDLETFTHDWEFLLSALPSGLDLEASLRDSGTFKRKRAVRSAEVLLRLALVYSFCGLSLRQTAAWARTQVIAKLSDVALLKRLRACSDWLGQLLGAKLAERAEISSRRDSSLRLRVVDATSVGSPGHSGIGWRVHVGFGLGQLAIDHIDVTGPEGGETFCRFPIESHDLVMGDRGYAHRRGLASVRHAGGHFLVRLNWANVPLQDLQGVPFYLFKALREIRGGQVAEYAVQTAPQESGEKIPALPARLIAVRKSAAAAKKERQKILREAAKKKRQADPRSLEAAGYTFVLTSVGEEELAATEVLELYRFRWQIELTFKRLKGLLGLEQLSAKDPHLARSALYAKLLAALLLEDLTGKFLSFSPWGFPLRASPPEPLESPANSARSYGSRHLGLAPAPRIAGEGLSASPLSLRFP